MISLQLSRRADKNDKRSFIGNVYRRYSFEETCCKCNCVIRACAPGTARDIRHTSLRAAGRSLPLDKILADFSFAKRGRGNEGDRDGEQRID